MKFRILVENLLSEKDEYISKKIFDDKSGYNISKDEIYIYDMLKERWPDVVQSYTDDRFVNPETHRHFQADFYIPSEDMFCNYNKHFKHGRRKYNPEDETCIDDVNWLKSKASPDSFYEKVLHTWTVVDPIKREVAEQQGFKFVEWFNLDEFNTWYENPNLTYEEYKYAPLSLQYDSDEYFKEKERGRDIFGNDSDPYAP